MKMPWEQDYPASTVVSGGCMSDIISRKNLKEHLDMVCVNNTPWGKAQQAYIECFKRFIDNEVSIEEKEAVKLIWSAQIDDLITKIRKIKDYEVSNGSVYLHEPTIIKILEEAKG